ncbi:hypothetical protein TI39_contig4187g00003 [Zymoseptoria brevis]|uniref:Uncharacterized protein n=1 Tax=Zymoseptoria brevis TaxID=1047168 RepID=A0A0F4GAY9_9PEZI|nr:hypothetical protein TI39_contig4187g00003 [Zymoseptoria brevis]
MDIGLYCRAFPVIWSSTGRFSGRLTPPAALPLSHIANHTLTNWSIDTGRYCRGTHTALLSVTRSSCPSIPSTSQVAHIIPPTICISTGHLQQVHQNRGYLDGQDTSSVDRRYQRIGGAAAAKLKMPGTSAFAREFNPDLVEGKYRTDFIRMEARHNRIRESEASKTKKLVMPPNAFVECGKKAEEEARKERPQQSLQLYNALLGSIGEVLGPNAPVSNATMIIFSKIARENRVRISTLARSLEQAKKDGQQQAGLALEVEQLQSRVQEAEKTATDLQAQMVDLEERREDSREAADQADNRATTAETSLRENVHLLGQTETKLGSANRKANFWKDYACRQKGDAGKSIVLAGATSKENAVLKLRLESHSKSNQEYKKQCSELEGERDYLLNIQDGLEQDVRRADDTILTSKGKALVMSDRYERERGRANRLAVAWILEGKWLLRNANGPPYRRSWAENKTFPGSVRSILYTTFQPMRGSSRLVLRWNSISPRGNPAFSTLYARPPVFFLLRESLSDNDCDPGASFGFFGAGQRSGNKVGCGGAVPFGLFRAASGFGADLLARLVGCDDEAGGGVERRFLLEDGRGATRCCSSSS